MLGAALQSAEKKYHVDVTADDPVPDLLGTVSRGYFLVSDTVLNRAGYVDYATHCTDTTYEKYDMFTGFYMQFIWNDDIQKFYYIDMDKVKTTSDFTETAYTFIRRKRSETDKLYYN